MYGLGAFLGVLLLVLYFGVIIFLITLFWRITVALERISRHLLEIARDVKMLSRPSGDDEE
jgi:hypothetical protein